MKQQKPNSYLTCTTADIASSVHKTDEIDIELSKAFNRFDATEIVCARFVRREV